MIDLNNLVPNRPIGICVVINNGAPFNVIGLDFVTFGLLGGEGSPVNLFFAGLDPDFNGIQRREGVATVLLQDGDTLTIGVQDSEVPVRESAIGNFENAIASLNCSASSALEEGNFPAGWRFRIETSDGTLFNATSAPFETVQAIVDWRPGAAHASFHIESLTVMEDGSTKGKTWKEKTLLSGMSIKITIESMA